MFRTKERLIEDLNKIIRKLEKAVEGLEEEDNFGIALDIIETVGKALIILPRVIYDSRMIEEMLEPKD